MTNLEKFNSGLIFRNGKFPDNGNRYYRRNNDVVLVGSYFDVEQAACPTYISRIEDDKVFCKYVYREINGDSSEKDFNLSDLIFDEDEKEVNND
jgi:hypothetical protein